MQYFKHMANMRRDPAMRRVIRKFGLRGYGLYNAIVETVADNLTSESPDPDIEDVAEDFALDFNEPMEEIQAIIDFMLDPRQGLLSIDHEHDDRIACPKIYKFLQTNQTRSPSIQALIQHWTNEKALRRLRHVETTSDNVRLSNGGNGERKKDEKDEKARTREFVSEKHKLNSSTKGTKEKEAIEQEDRLNEDGYVEED
jgi:hypothetical protein